VTEWSLQKKLTANWLSRPLVTLADEQFFLVAWEVMANYRINDARKEFNKPSIDFLFLDARGQLVALELKRRVSSQRQAWWVLCQVTRRAHLLGEAYDETQLIGAYQHCRSGLDGRVTVPSEQVEDLRLAHAAAFGLDPLDHLPGVPVRRFVMAESFGPSFDEVLLKFTQGTRAEIANLLGGFPPKGELAEFIRLPDLTRVDPSPVRPVHLDGSTSPGHSGTGAH
jgi:hypothetical protein